MKDVTNEAGQTWEKLWEDGGRWRGSTVRGPTQKWKCLRQKKNSMCSKMIIHLTECSEVSTTGFRILLTEQTLSVSVTYWCKVRYSFHANGNVIKFGNV
jgi:hypothetical protein